MPYGTGLLGYFSCDFDRQLLGLYAIRNWRRNTGLCRYVQLTTLSTGVPNYALYASTSSATGYAGYFDGQVKSPAADRIKLCRLPLPAPARLSRQRDDANPQISVANVGFYTPAANTICGETNGCRLSSGTRSAAGTDYLKYNAGQSWQPPSPSRHFDRGANG